LSANVPFVYYPKRKARGDYMYLQYHLVLHSKTVWWRHSVLSLQYDPDNKQRVFPDTAL